MYLLDSTLVQLLPKNQQIQEKLIKELGNQAFMQVVLLDGSVVQAKNIKVRELPSGIVVKTEKDKANRKP